VALVLIAAEAIELAIVFINPAAVSLLVPWPATPLNARFIAALYTSLGLGVLACAFARSFYEARIVLVGIAFVTISLLILTVPWFGRLTPFPLWWTVFYLIDPLIVAFAFWRLGWGGASPPGPNPLRLFWILQAVIFGVSGLCLLLFPKVAVALWPWGLTVELSQMYSMFFLTLALASILAGVEPRWAGVRILVAMMLVFFIMVLGVSIYHFERFKPNLSTPIWFIAFGIETLAFGAILIQKQFRPTTEGVEA
jgi:hypothetical protein